MPAPDFKNVKPLTRMDVDILLNKAGNKKLNLSGHNLRGIDLSNFDLDEIDLSNADLTMANLSGADLTKANFARSILVRSDLSNVNIYNTNFNEADLREATLVKAHGWYTKLNGADLSDANLTESDITGAELKGANLERANLTEASLHSNQFIGAKLNGANLTITQLNSSNLSEADMREAIISETDFTNADLRKALLSENALDNAIISNTKVRGTTISASNQNKANHSNFPHLATQSNRHNTSPVLGALGTPGLTKREAIESLQIEQIAQANPANIQEVAATQLPIGNRYYESVLLQSQRSFLSALVLSIVGTLLIFAAIILLVIRQPANTSYVSLAGGVILNVIGGLNFYLYGRASALLLTFQPPLDRIGRFLLANSVCENLDGDLKNTTRAKLVEIIANVPTKTTSNEAENLPSTLNTRNLQRRKITRKN